MHESTPSNAGWEREGKVRVGDHDLAWISRGDSSSTVLLLMGLGGRTSDWGEAFPAALAQHHRVIAFDNRGTGRSARVDRAFSLQDLADDAIGVLDALGVARAHVVGISMGGMIAQRVAAQAPRRVDKLVLMSTHVGGLRVFWPHPRAVQVLFPEPGTPAAQIVRARMAGIAAPGFADKNPHTVDAIVASALGAPTPLRTYRYQLQAVLRDDRYPVLRHIEAETLVVHGDADPLVPFENGKLLARKIPHAHLAVLHGCGHLPMWEQPEQLCGVVTGFLS